MSYSFVGIDEGKQQIFRGNTSDGILWTTGLADYPTARSLQRLDESRVLAGYDLGYFIIDINDGRILHDCRRWKNVTAVRRTSEGRTLVCGLNLDGPSGIRVLTLDENDTIVDSAGRRGSYVRLMSIVGSPQGDSTYLLCMNQRILETDTALRKKRRFRSPGFKHAWMARRLESGDTLVSAGYGAYMALFDSRGQFSLSFGRKGEVPAEVNPNFYASFDIAADGSILVANWQGHGPDCGDCGRQLLSFSPEGTLLDHWSFTGISSFQGLLLI